MITNFCSASSPESTFRKNEKLNNENKPPDFDLVKGNEEITAMKTGISYSYMFLV
jgi:hypothetical protein